MGTPVIYKEDEKDLAAMVARLPATKNTHWVVCWDPDGNRWRLERQGNNTGRCLEARTSYNGGSRLANYYFMKGYVAKLLELRGGPTNI
jgi:hypothetical protein